MIALHLPGALGERIAAEARRAFPRECCGLLEGATDGKRITVVAAHPARNLSERPDRFEIDPADHFRLLRGAREQGNAIIGCYHSHPGGQAEPSPRDREGTGEAGFVWLIAAVPPEGPAALAAYLFDGTMFLPLEISGAGSLDPAAASIV